MTQTPAVPVSKNTDQPQLWWMKYLAMVAGVLAAVAGYLTVRNNVLSNEAIYHSTQAVLFQEQASDAWSQYQADSVKAHVLAVAQQTLADPAARQRFAAEEAGFRTTQPTIKKSAADLEGRRDSELSQSNHLLKERDLLQYAALAVQLGIALASVAAMVRSFRLFAAGAVIGILGIAITGYALFYHWVIHN